MPIFKNEKTALIGLLVLAFAFYFTSVHLLRAEQGIAFKKIDFEILGIYFFAVLIAIAFLLLKSKLLRIVLFVIGIGFALLLFFPFALLCFSQCPDNSKFIWTLVVASSFVYSGVYIWSMFQHKRTRVIVLSIPAVFYFVALVTSTPFEF